LREITIASVAQAAKRTPRGGFEREFARGKPRSKSERWLKRASMNSLTIIGGPYTVQKGVKKTGGRVRSCTKALGEILKRILRCRNRLSD